MYNRIVASPGNNIALGAQGGVLLLDPPGRAPGAMRLTDMQNRTWHLLREDGPDTGYPAPTTGDFPIQVVTRDLNIAFADFLSQTGIAPGLIERQVVLPVFAVLDYPVPADLQSLTLIEYNPTGGYPYALIPLSITEFITVTGGIIPPTTGQPRYYREPFAGYIRLQPQPDLGNAVGPGAGTVTINGSPVAGQSVTVTLVNGSTTVTSAPYVTVSTDTVETIAFNVANQINTSAAVTGLNAFCQPAAVAENVITITALAMPGTQITVSGAITGTGATIAPTSATNFTPTGDTMTWYYTGAGNLLINQGDTPQMPPQFHMAPVYRVLADYWERKQDPGQADRYMKKFDMAVARGKSYTFDSNRASQPTISGDDYTDAAWPEGGG